MDLERWWNNTWVRRKILTTSTSGTVHSSGVHFVRVDVDLQQLVTNGYLRSDYADLRVICQKGESSINVPYYIVDNTDLDRIYFAIQHNAASGEIFNDRAQQQFYYIYYDNPIQYDILQPSGYVNINFPQAPYSCHGSGYVTDYGTYIDKHFLRLDDDPALGNRYFTDETGHSSGINGDIAGGGVTKGHSGVLSQSCYFKSDLIDGTYPGFSGSFIEIPQTANHWGHSSGNWSVDFWYMAVGHSAYKYGGIFFKPETYSDRNGYPDVRVFTNPSYPNSRIEARHRVASTYSLTQNSNSYTLSPPDIPSGIWHHVRVAYRTGGDISKSAIHIYCNGNKKDTILNSLDNQAMYEVDLTSIFVGWDYTSYNNDGYMYKGFLEQLRYSTFVYPAMTGVDDYECPPDWVDTQYICGVGDEILSQSSSGSVGGIIYSKLDGGDAASGVLGGYARVWAGDNQIPIGGIINTRVQISGIIGGYLLSVIETSGFFGGFTIGSYGDIDIHSVENLSRALIKSCSDDQYLQQFSTDARYVLYQKTPDNFDAKVVIRKETKDEFDSQIIVNKIRKNPTVEISGFDLNYHTCRIGASGTAYDEDNEAFNSGIYQVSFIWGDGDFTQVSTPVVSGDLWRASHTYSHSGIYKPVVIVTDKNGRIGSDSTDLEMAPTGIGGYVFEYPFINLSGIPRSGANPLTVDYTAETSGVVGTYNIFWDFGNGISYYSNALTQTAQYNMPGDYTPIVRIEDASGVYIFDTLKLGYNR